MKLASLNDGSRDGQLVVVSTDLTLAHHASGIATRLREVLDDWNFLSPQLEDLYRHLNQGKARHAFAFEPAQCMAPLPRAARWVRCSGDVHAGRVEDAAPDDFLGPCQPVAPAASGLHIALRLTLLTGELPAAAAPAQALEGVRLLGLACEWQAQGAGAAHADTDRHAPPRAVSCAPVVVTADELGDAWTGAVAAWAVRINDAACGLDAAASPGDWSDAGAWLARLAALRRVRSGTLLGLPAVRPLAPGAHAAAALAMGDTLSASLSVAAGGPVFGAFRQAVLDAGTP